jgi:hypothetical protein
VGWVSDDGAANYPVTVCPIEGEVLASMLRYVDNKHQGQKWLGLNTGHPILMKAIGHHFPHLETTLCI